MEERFYFCNACGNLFFATIASGITPHCCGREMTLFHANEEEGNGEKHLPVVSCTDSHTVKVRVGSTLHPMSSNHNIRFICVETDNSVIIRYLNEEERPEVVIRCDGTPKAVYAYCNIHGLWRKDLKCETV